MRGQLKSMLAMSCAVLMTVGAVWGIRLASDVRHQAAEIASLELQH